MKKITKVAILMVLAVTLSTVSYAVGFHFGLDVGAVGSAGFTHSKASHKFEYCDKVYGCQKYDTDKDNTTKTMPKKDQIENSRQGGGYLQLQLGADIDVADSFNITPYLGLGAVREFQGASMSLMSGIGVIGFVRDDDDLSYLAGIESHGAAFGFREVVPKGDAAINAKKTMVLYNGRGITVSGGILYDVLAVKLLYISNNYKLKEFDSGNKFLDKYYTSQYPDKVSAQSVGLSVGLKF